MIENTQISNENVEKDYHQMDKRIVDLEVNKQQLHDLLIAIESQLEEVESFYAIVKKEVIKNEGENDFIDINIRQLRSLIEIAQSHNRSIIDIEK